MQPCGSVQMTVAPRWSRRRWIVTDAEPTTRWPLSGNDLAFNVGASGRRRHRTASRPARADVLHRSRSRRRHSAAAAPSVPGATTGRVCGSTHKPGRPPNPDCDPSRWPPPVSADWRDVVSVNRVLATWLRKINAARPAGRPLTPPRTGCRWPCSAELLS